MFFIYFCRNNFSYMDIRIGNGYDVHALAEGLPLWLGGVKVESPLDASRTPTAMSPYMHFVMHF